MFLRRGSGRQIASAVEVGAVEASAVEASTAEAKAVDIVVVEVVEVAKVVHVDVAVAVEQTIQVVAKRRVQQSGQVERVQVEVVVAVESQNVDQVDQVKEIISVKGLVVQSTQNVVDVGREGAEIVSNVEV